MPHLDRDRADALTRAWNDAMDAEDARPRRRRLLADRAGGRGPSLRAVLLATGLLVVGVAPFAVAKTGDALKEGQRNGTATRETQIVSNAPATTATTGGFATRQSNLSSSGGGAIYGCRSTTGSTATNPPKNPCIRSNNLSTGLAFEFNATSGAQAGTITAGAGGDAKKPFTTNATGVATGLNADRLDGIEGKQITDAIAALGGSVAGTPNAINAAKERWVRIGENDAGDGAVILAQSGGFKLVNCYQANGNCYIDAGTDVTNRAIQSETLVDNVNLPGSTTATQLNGSASSSPCFLATVNCGPAGTDSTNGGNNGVFVVTPRDINGDTPAANDRYSFTATVSAATAG